MRTFALVALIATLVIVAMLFGDVRLDAGSLIIA